MLLDLLVITYVFFLITWNIYICMYSLRLVRLCANGRAAQQFDSIVDLPSYLCPCTADVCVCVLPLSSAKTFHSSTHISVLMCSSNLLLSFAFTFHQCGQSEPKHPCHCRRSTHPHSLTSYARRWWQAWKTLHTHTYYCKMYKEDTKYSRSTERVMEWVC